MSVPDPRPLEGWASLLRRSEPRRPARAHRQATAPRPEDEVRRPEHLARTFRRVRLRGLRLRSGESASLGEDASEGLCPRRSRKSRASTHRGRHASAGGGRAAAARGEAAQAACAVAMVAWSRRGGAKPEAHLARLRQAFRPGAYLPLSQTGFGMDHASGKASRASRPVDVAGFGRIHPAQAGTSARSGPEAALGTPLRHCSPDTGAGPSRSFGAFGRARHAREAAETLWALSGTAQRAPLRTGQALSGRQEGRLNPHDDSGREFCEGLYIQPKTLVLKMQAKNNRRRNGKGPLTGLLRAPTFLSCAPSF